MEAEAKEYLKNGNWLKALKLYNILLTNKELNERLSLSYVQNRFECLYQLQKHEIVVKDSQEILKQPNLKNVHIKFQLIRSLCALNNITEAKIFVERWLSIISRERGNTSLKFEHFLQSFLRMDSKEKVAVWLADFSEMFQTIESDTIIDNMLPCIYCNLYFEDRNSLMAHCRTQEHETMIMSDEGHDWVWRHPPRGVKTDSYVLCENWQELGYCKYGNQCVEAHGEAELNEWIERLKYREMKLARAKNKQLYGKLYAEELLEKWLSSSNPNNIISDCIEGVKCTCSSSTSTIVTAQNSKHDWVFALTTTSCLNTVALLQDTHRNHYRISRITLDQIEVTIGNDQECSLPRYQNGMQLITYEVTVSFHTSIFGTFRQSVVFDFGSIPVLVKHLCVDVIPDGDVKQISEVRKEMALSIQDRWTVENTKIVPFTSSLFSETKRIVEWENELKLIYPCPQNDNFLLSNDIITKKKISRNNYRQYMHEFLYMEEIATYDLMSRYNLTTEMKLAQSYCLSPNSTAFSTVKYSNNNELFASISLGSELSEDTNEGRAILLHCYSVYLRPLFEGKQITKVYEAIIEDRGKNAIYLRLSATTVKELNLTPDTCLEVQIQFQLNRTPYCEKHYAVDKLKDVSIIFPDIFIEPSIPWSPSRQWSRELDPRLNLKQKEALMAATTSLDIRIPPILIIGPFGTGKTFTLAQTIKELIKTDSNKILLCTHSNSAADLYIKDYLHPWYEDGLQNAKPFRIYYHKRWVTTVSPIVQKYCNIGVNSVGANQFQEPTIDDIVEHKIIIVTLSTSVCLSAMGLPRGTFTHILLDEAAQSLECEAIIPLTLADERTRIVLAGDHMQLGPEINSKLAKDSNYHISLLERLYTHYCQQFPCTILLCENYRAHESIIQFTSDSFYDQKLVSSSKQPAHDKFYPLTFFTTLGEDLQDVNSTAFYNISEVYEVVERVKELKRTWPSDWGELNDQSILVVTPYSDQVFRIRSELRKKRIPDVSVERVMNVQGKQFRAIILSTVRTRNTCAKKKANTNEEYGFLSSTKLLNTAITRAQSLVAVVGDPVALCSVGRCSKIWERFIQICNNNNSFHGMTWQQLKLQLDGIELKKIYNLNPLAPEFVPRKYREAMLAPNSNPVVDTSRNPFVYPNVSKIGPPLINFSHPRPNLRLPHPPIVPDISIPYNPMCFFPMAPFPQQFKTTPPPQCSSNNFPKEDELPDDAIRSLLPPNTTVQEMLKQPAAVQQFWYKYLSNTFGLEAAKKFYLWLQKAKPKNETPPREPLQMSANVKPFHDSNLLIQDNFCLPLRNCKESNPLYLRGSNQS